MADHILKPDLTLVNKVLNEGVARGASEVRHGTSPNSLPLSSTPVVQSYRSSIHVNFIFLGKSIYFKISLSARNSLINLVRRHLVN